MRTKKQKKLDNILKQIMGRRKLIHMSFEGVLSTNIPIKF